MVRRFLPHTIILPYCQIVSDGLQENAVYTWLFSKILGSYAFKKSCECWYPYKAQSLYVSNTLVAAVIGIHFCSTAEHTTSEKINAFIIDNPRNYPIFYVKNMKGNTYDW